MSKTPLQAVVGVICDCLLQLPGDDQERALEAVRVTLGLRAPVAPLLSAQVRGAALPIARAVRQDPGAPALPMVRVEMVNDRPVVLGEALEEREGGGFTRVRQLRPLRQLPPQGAVSNREAPPSLPRGYVRALRPGT